MIRSGATEFHYEREEQPLPKIGRWRDTLDQLLLANEAKAARERLTLIRLFEELRGRGYDGGYDAVRRYARRWAKEHGAATASVYVPLSFAPGEAYQFDWSHEVVLLSGVTVTVKVAHKRLWIGTAGTLECIGGDKESLERIEVLFVHVDARVRQGHRSSAWLTSW